MLFRPSPLAWLHQRFSGMTLAPDNALEFFRLFIDQVEIRRYQPAPLRSAMALELLKGHDQQFGCRTNFAVFRAVVMGDQLAVQAIDHLKRIGRAGFLFNAHGAMLPVRFRVDIKMDESAKTPFPDVAAEQISNSYHPIIRNR